MMGIISFIACRVRAWAVGLVLGVISIGSWFAWRARERKVRKEAKASGELAERLEAASLMESNAIITPEQARRVREDWDQEVTEKVRAIREQADSSRAAIRARWGKRK